MDVSETEMLSAGRKMQGKKVKNLGSERKSERLNPRIVRES